MRAEVLVGPPEEELVEAAQARVVRAEAGLQELITLYTTITLLRAVTIIFKNNCALY